MSLLDHPAPLKPAFNFVVQSRFTGRYAPARGLEWTSDLALALDFPSRDSALGWVWNNPALNRQHFRYVTKRGALRNPYEPVTAEPPERSKPVLVRLSHTS